MILFYKKVNKEVPDLVYATKGSVGFDLTAQSILAVHKGTEEVKGEKLEKIKKGFNERNYLKIRGHERILIGTGIKIDQKNTQTDLNLEFQIRSRSSLALKRGLGILNSPGTIDADYEGEIKIILYNSSSFLSFIEKGERIAQLVPSFVERITDISTDGVNYSKVTYLSEEKRGEKGFGSSGK